MTGFAYVIAQSPWGPVAFGSAVSLDEFAALKIGQPAHVERCEGIDAGQVVETARQALGRGLVEGWHNAKPVEAIARLKEAARAVLAKVVAGAPVNAAPAAPMGQGEASSDSGSFATKHAHAREARAAPGMTTNDGAGVLPAGTRASPRRLRVLGPDVDVRAIRAGLRMTQATFAATFGLPVATVRDWEQGRAAPDMAARVLLAVIECRPNAVREALGRYG